MAISSLKAIFFVKKLEGVREYHEKKEFNNKTTGFKMQIEFFDGETMLGLAEGYSSEKQGFWLFPADPKSNNLRIYVICAALKNIKKIGVVNE